MSPLAKSKCFKRFLHIIYAIRHQSRISHISVVVVRYINSNSTVIFMPHTHTHIQTHTQTISVASYENKYALLHELMTRVQFK